MTILTPDRADGFIRANTVLQAPPHVPEILLHLADEAHDLWHRTEEELQELGLQPPFWAFAWAGGQGLARYVLDHPETVAGKRVLDFASTSPRARGSSPSRRPRPARPRCSPPTSTGFAVARSCSTRRRTEL